MPLQQRRLMITWAALEKLLAAGWGRWAFPATQQSWGHTWSKWPVLGSPVWETRTDSKESNEDTQRWLRNWSSCPMSLLIRINTWRECAKWMKPGSFQCYLVKGPGAMVTKWNAEGSVWTSGNTSLWGWLSPGAGFLGRMRSLHPWQYSKAVWTCSQTNISRWPSSSRGVSPYDLLPTLHVLWFCDSVNERNRRNKKTLLTCHFPSKPCTAFLLFWHMVLNKV